MDEKLSIATGDYVTVTFCASASIFRARVLYVPQATGDSWHLEMTDGKVVYVQLFERMDKED